MSGQRAFDQVVTTRLDYSASPITYPSSTIHHYHVVDQFAHQPTHPHRRPYRSRLPSCGSILRTPDPGSACPNSATAAQCQYRPIIIPQTPSCPLAPQCPITPLQDIELDTIRVIHITRPPMNTAHQEDGAKAAEQGIKEEAVWEVGKAV
jgi:hypothetical protein